MTLTRDPAKARAWQERSAKQAEANRRARPKPVPTVPKPLTRAKPKARKPKPAKHPAIHRDTKPEKPRKRMPARNSKRAAARRLEQFGTPEQTAMINTMPCVCEGRHPECTGGPSEPSHIVSRGAGGTAADIVPKSSGCHRAWHAHGRDTYLAAIGWTWEMMRAAADRTFALVSCGGMRPSAPW